MPGKHLLAEQLAIPHQTVEAALVQLERDGVLEAQGSGRPRKILPLKEGAAVRRLRVGMLFWDAADRALDYIANLQNRLTEAGHQIVVAPKTLTELKMNVPRMARLVEQTKADSWVVCAGSLEVLEWFSQSTLPSFAYFGRMVGLPIAGLGTDKRAAILELVSTLVKLGHRRIVMMLRKQHRLPQPSPNTMAYLRALESNGIKNTEFCLPEWEESAEGFHTCLKALFRVTPPTALIVDEPLLFTATLQFLVARGLRAPRDVSLIYQGDEAIFDWCVPTVARIETDLSRGSHHLGSWAKNVSRGKKDLRQTFLPSNYVPGETVGPAPGGR